MSGEESIPPTESVSVSRLLAVAGQLATDGMARESHVFPSVSMTIL